METELTVPSGTLVVETKVVTVSSFTSLELNNYQLESNGSFFTPEGFQANTTNLYSK